MKKFLSGILATSMALSLLALPSFATEQAETQQIPMEITANQTEKIQQETLSSTEYEAGYFEFTQIIDHQYQDGGRFSTKDGLVSAKLNGKWGYIDIYNNVIVPFEYDFAGLFNEGKAIVGVSAGSGKYTFGFVDTTGKYTPIMVQNMEFSTGSAKHTGSYSPLVASIYGTDTFTYFYNGVNTNLYYSDSKSSLGGHMGLIVDSTTAIATVVEGYQLNFYNEGVITANSAKGTNARVLDKNGNLIWDMGSYNVYAMSHGYIPAENTSGKHGIMNYATRDWQLQPIYNDVKLFNKEGAATALGDTNLFVVKNTSNKYGAVDLNGNTVIPFQYTNLFSSKEGSFTFQTSSGYGFLDASTNEVTVSATFSKASSLNNGLAAVQKSGKSYLVDRTGTQIKGSDVLDASIYFSGNYISTPSEYVTTTSGGKVGFGQILFQPELPVQGDTSDWALEKVISAIKAHLVPANQQNLYTSNVTRQDFALLAIISLAERFNMDHDTYVKAKTGKTMTEWVNEYPFNDTNNQYVASAYGMGLVNGKGDEKYDPYAYITRQEVAVIMEGMARMINESYSAPAYPFNDRSDIATWALSQVDYTAAEGIMGDSGGGNFKPENYCTREQTFTILYNFYANL